MFLGHFSLLKRFFEILLPFYHNQEVHFTNLTFFAAANEKGDFFQEAFRYFKIHQSTKKTVLGVQKLFELKRKRPFFHEIRFRSAQESFPVKPKNRRFSRNCGPCQRIEVPKQTLDSQKYHWTDSLCESIHSKPLDSRFDSFFAFSNNMPQNRHFFEGHFSKFLPIFTNQKEFFQKISQECLG